jgi:hypothetical protein
MSQPNTNAKTNNSRAMVVVKKQQAPVSYGFSDASTRRQRAKPWCLTRREYISDVFGSTSNFAIVPISLNPGLASFLPWCSSIANSFDYYRFKRLRFFYLPETSTDNKGQVVLCIDPDPNDQAPTAMTQALNYNVRLVVVPWMEGSVSVPNDVLTRLPKFLTRNSIVAGDYNTYDVGSLFIITGGNLDGTKMGQVWVEYDVDFYEPQVPLSTAPLPKNNSSFYIPTLQSLATGVATTANFNGTSFNPLGLVPNAGTFTGLLGSFIVYTQVVTQSTTLTAGSLQIQKNGTIAISTTFPALLAGYATTNAEIIMSLVPSDVVSVVVSLTGTGNTLLPGVNSILVFTPA